MPRLARRLLIYLLLYSLWLFTVFVFTQGMHAPSDWLLEWARWDAKWYEQIWSDGYSLSDPRSIVFPPGYSILVGTAAELTGLGFHLAAALLNTVCLFGAWVIAAELGLRLFALPPVLLFVMLLTSPPSYFIFTAYSDSVFTLLLWTTLAVALLSQNRLIWRLLEFSLLLLTPWMRITGFALISWLALRRWSAVGALLSLLAWLLINHLVAGSAFYFISAQQQFNMPTGHFFDGLWAGLKFLFPVQYPGPGVDTRSYLQFQVLPLFYLVALLFSAGWFFFRRQWLLGITTLSILLVSHNQGFWRSVVRYDLPLFPCLQMALLSLLNLRDRPRVSTGFALGIFGMIQFLLLIYFANSFRDGYWAF
jgi:hypothetical protein